MTKSETLKIVRLRTALCSLLVAVRSGAKRKEIDRLAVAALGSDILTNAQTRFKPSEYNRVSRKTFDKSAKLARAIKVKKEAPSAEHQRSADGGSAGRHPITMSKPPDTPKAPRQTAPLAVAPC